MKVIIELSTKEAADAVVNGTLALLLNDVAQDEGTRSEVKKIETTTPEQPVPVQTPAVPVEPVQQTQHVPTTAPTYTLDELAKASTSIMDEGRMAELQALVQSFGITTLAELSKDKYGAFALKLREMGAAI